ncbi:MAG TPA: hypothetical protein VHM20_05760 [Gammaproteobacteria bacterium]|jgi:hypothetical protein|nr:hypothetical protein [Gammaproteobacteria bacterium]
MKNNLSTEQAELLKEILLPPSEKILPERFSQSEDTEAGQCKGVCRSGVCITFV